MIIDMPLVPDPLPVVELEIGTDVALVVEVSPPAVLEFEPAVSIGLALEPL